MLAQNLYRLQGCFISSGFLGFAAICRDVHFVDFRTAAFAAGRRPTRWIAPPLFASNEAESESDRLELSSQRKRERSSLLPPSDDDDGQRECDHSSVQYRRRRWGTTIATTSVDTESEIANVPDFSSNDEAELFINVRRDNPSSFFSFHPSRQSPRIRKRAKAKVQRTSFLHVRRDRQLSTSVYVRPSVDTKNKMKRGSLSI